MNPEIKQRAIDELVNYDKCRDWCNKFGMFLDINGPDEDGEDPVSYTYGEDIDGKAGEKEVFVWNNFTWCTAGFSYSLTAVFSNMQAVISVSQHDYTEDEEYYCELSEEDILRFYEILLYHTPYGQVIDVESVEFAHEHGLIFDCNNSRNLVIGGMMAHRLAWENTLVVQRMLHYVDLGVNKTIAFMLGFSYDVDGMICECDWHVPIGGGLLGMNTLKAFVNDDWVEEETLTESLCFDQTIHNSWRKDGVGLSIDGAVREFAKERAAAVEVINPFAATLQLIVPKYNDEDIASYFKQPEILKQLGVSDE